MLMLIPDVLVNNNPFIQRNPIVLSLVYGKQLLQLVSLLLILLISFPLCNLYSFFCIEFSYWLVMISLFLRVNGRFEQIVP
jgi:hypothetical protein